MRIASFVLFAALVLAPQVRAGEAALPRRATVAIVAVRGSTQLTLCPVIGKQVSLLPVSTDGRTVVIAAPQKTTPITVYHPRDGVLVVEMRERDVITSKVSLADASRGPASAQVPSIDAEARKELEALLRSAGYAVVDEPARADFVLYVQSTYRPSPRSVAVVSGLGDPPGRPGQRNEPASRPDDIKGQTEAELARRDGRTGGRDAAPPPSTPNPSDVDRRWDGGSFDAHEWQGDWRESALAVLVPVAAYRPNDVSTTVAARRWEGFAAGRFRTPAGTPMLAPAALEALVQQLLGKAKRSPVYLPVCVVGSAR